MCCKHTRSADVLLCALQVNARLAEEEKQREDGDPFYPKLQWPPPELCALCRAPLLRGAEAAKPQWNEGEVARFLLKHYTAAPGTKLLRPQAAKKPGHAWGGRCGCCVVLAYGVCVSSVHHRPYLCRGVMLCLQDVDTKWIAFPWVCHVPSVCLDGACACPRKHLARRAVAATSQAPRYVQVLLALAAVAILIATIVRRRAGQIRGGKDSVL